MRRTPRWLLTIALGLATLSGSPPSQSPLEPWPPGTLDIHHIHPGRGNAAFVQFPDGTTLLIDAGAIPEASNPAVGPARPDSTLRPGQWIGRYIAKRAATLDYALVTHYHDDHIGALSIDAPKTATAAGYKLTGLTDVADLVPIARLFDRGEEPAAIPSPLLANYRAFRQSLGARAGVLEAGRADRPDHPPFMAANSRSVPSPITAASGLESPTKLGTPFPLIGKHSRSKTGPTKTASARP